MSNVIELSAFKGARSPTSSDEGEQIESHAWGRRYRRSERNMHNLVFRSYSLIVEAPEAELVRDVQINTDKAKVKLRKIREQIVIDRDRAAARADMMTKAEAKLSAAIELAKVSEQGTGTGAGRETGAPAEGRAPPRAPSSQERGDILLMRWRLERATGVPPVERLSGDDRS
jgi:hypothetical protein